MKAYHFNTLVRGGGGVSHIDTLYVYVPTFSVNFSFAIGGGVDYIRKRPN